MNAASEARLNAVDPVLAAKVRAAVAILEAEATEILVISGLRTAAQQNALYAQGRTAPGHIVTNASAGHSMHNYGLAVDVAPYTDASHTVVNWKVQTPQYQRMVAVLKEQGLEWGGDWRGNLGDFDHFQLTGLPASPSAVMLADYTKDSADLPAIWQRASDGTYDT